MSEVSAKLDDLRIARPRAPDTSSRISWIAGAAVVTLIVAAALWWLLSSPAVEVRASVARAAEDVSGGRTILNASGYVTARREATVSSKVTGKVAEILIEEGVRVDAGQILARLDDTNIGAGLRLARAQVESARLTAEETRVMLAEAEREWQRQSSLFKSSVASRAAHETAESAMLALRARLALQENEVVVAERNVAVWEQQADDAIIRAPFAGVVTSKNAQPGEMISPMSSGGFTRTGICTIVDMESLEIEIDVNESYINRVTPGQTVVATLDAYPEWRIPCHVIAIIPTADRQKSTVRVRVGFAQSDPRILPQMAVKVAFQEQGSAPPAQRLVNIPKGAVRSEGERSFVFVIEDGRARRRGVTVANIVGEEAFVSQGIQPGEVVADDPASKLEEGRRVKERIL